MPIKIMTCGELARILAARPPGQPVILQAADECAPLSRAEEGMYVAERHGMSGDVYDTPEQAAELARQGKQSAPAPDGAVRCFYLATEI